MEKQTIKLNESQLRSIIRESLNNILNENIYDEGRKRTRQSYYEIEDYRQVPGVDLCIDTKNLIRMTNPKNRNLDRLIQTMMDDPEVLHMYMDDQDRLHAFFYHGCPPTYTEKDNALDEYFWRDTLGEPSMKGIAKQIPVMLYEYVPDFEEIWNEEKARWKGWREEDRKSEEDGVGTSKYGKGERATMYNTVPTLGTLGGM